MNKVIIIGAGKSGRGFIARLLFGYSDKITFIDKDTSLIDRLNKEKCYSISFFGNSQNRVKICNYTAYTWEQSSFNDVQMIFVSVGSNNLKNVGECLKSRLSYCKKYFIIACENCVNAAEILEKIIDMPNVIVSEGAIFCTTIEDKNLDILSEPYPYLQINNRLLKGKDLGIGTIRQIDGFTDLMQRKLYTYNAASAIIAYNGWNMGYLSYSDASNDEKISNILGKFYDDINHAISMEYGCDFEEQQEFALLSWKKFKDHAIKDTIERNARDPLKKLTPDERIIKPMNLLDKYGFDCSVLENAAALAILYSGLEQDFDRILNDICMISKDSCHYTNIVELINDHKNRIMDNTVHLL